MLPAVVYKSMVDPLLQLLLCPFPLGEALFLSSAFALSFYLKVLVPDDSILGLLARSPAQCKVNLLNSLCLPRSVLLTPGDALDFGP